MDRRHFLQLVGATGIVMASGGILSACGSSNGSGELDYKNWDAVVEAAKGSTVIYMGSKTDELLNTWVEDHWAKTLKDKYDITLQYVDDAGIGEVLVNDKANNVGETDGTFDIGWINGGWFKDPQEVGAYFGPISDYLPNYKQYVNADSDLVKYDFGYETKGYEAPYSFAEMIFITDTDRMPEMPDTPEAFLAAAKKYPGKLTYIAANDDASWGQSLMVMFAYATCGGPEAFKGVKADKEELRKKVQPLIKWLRDLNPYLWKKGKTFPSNDNHMQQLFLSGEINIMQQFAQYDVGQKIKDGTYPKTCKGYVWKSGDISNNNFMGIPYNAPNKAGALVAVNEMLDPQTQFEKYECGQGYTIDLSKVDNAMKTKFEQVDLGPNNPSNEAIQKAAVPEMETEVEQLLVEIWKEDVVGKTN